MNCEDGTIEKIKICEWTDPSNGILGEIKTGCGKKHLAIDMLDYIFCPFCGGKIGGEIFDNLLRGTKTNKSENEKMQRDASIDSGLLTAAGENTATPGEE